MPSDNDSHFSRSARRSVGAALAAATLFGASTPVAKLLLGAVSPLLLAGLLYAGSFIGLSIYCAGSSLGKVKRRINREAGLKRGDIPYLLGTILCGGIAAPLLLIDGLLYTTGTAASLLLNLEGVATTLIAALVFREHVGGRIWAAAVLMLFAGAMLAYTRPAGGWSLNTGSVLVMLSSVMWAVDNNITTRLSHRDPLVIARYKGFAAAVTNLSIALLLGAALPAAPSVAGALALGVFGYGASLVFFIYSLRDLGAARTSTYFGAAPFIGVAASLVILHERLTLRIAGAALIMAAGLRLIMREYHEHVHTHDPFRHEHSHFHDDHHDHGHDGGAEEPHSHEHEHARLTHSHPHAPDIHHFHRH